MKSGPKNNTPPKYSILIVGYRSLRFLPDLFTSLLLQTYEDFEVLFLDNGSPDAEHDWIRGAVSDPRFRSYRISRNQYFGGGVNLLSGIASGEYLILLNPDATVAQDWLSQMDAALTETGYEGMAAAVTGFAGLTAAITPHGLTRLVHARGKSNVMGGCCLAIRREAFMAVKGFDESFRMYFEDVDLCWRLHGKGYRIGYAPTAQVFHAGHGSSKASSPANRFLSRRNRVWSYIRNARPLTLAAFAAAYPVVSVGTAVASMLRGRWRLAAADLMALPASIPGIPRALKLRWA